MGSWSQMAEVVEEGSGPRDCPLEIISLPGGLSHVQMAKHPAHGRVT